jgi:hypothetical protein
MGRQRKEGQNMSVSQLIAQTAVTFFAATLGASLGAFLTRRTEKYKHLQELRSAAYIDFVAGVANAAHQTGGIAEVADARTRIAIYGGKDVIRSLSQFIALGAQTVDPKGMQAFAELCSVMRAETGREFVSAEDVHGVLFNKI